MRLCKLGLAALGAAGLALLPGCKRDDSPAAAASGSGAQTAGAAGADGPKKPVVVLTPHSGGGTLRGTVSFVGTPPAPAPAIRSTDPACQDMGQTDTSVRVKDGKLQNAVVRVLGPVDGMTGVPTEPIVIDQKRCTYFPRVQAAVAGQPILIRNSDGTLHNVRALAGTKSIFNVAQPPMGKPVERPLPASAETLRLKCDIHPWMAAWVVLSPHPFFATTGEQGAFSLEHVPPGTYTLEAWHEVLGTKKTEVRVEEGKALTVSFDFSEADMPKPNSP